MISDKLRGHIHILAKAMNGKGPITNHEGRGKLVEETGISYFDIGDALGLMTEMNLVEPLTHELGIVASFKMAPGLSDEGIEDQVDLRMDWWCEIKALRKERDELTFLIAKINKMTTVEEVPDNG